MIVSTASSSSNPTLFTSPHLNHSPNPNNLGFLSFTRSPHSIFTPKCRVYSSPDRSQRNPRNWSNCEEELEEERKVNCEVDVVSWRERRIRGTVVVHADVGAVWNALTDYERLAEFVPNLTSSGKIPCPHPGRIWLEQRGVQRALYWHIEARVVLDLQEFPDSVSGPELHFSMVDGDFKKFEGKWSVESEKRSSTTNLSYEVNVIPRFNFPAIFLERIIKSDLPINLKAVACRAERNFVLNQKTYVLGRTLTTASKPSVTSAYVHSTGALLEKDQLLSGVSTKEPATSTSGSFPPLSQSELNHKWGVFGKICGLDKPCMVDEVHFRRFDGLLENGGVHRGVIATITVKAPVREVWNVLTAYETLPEIVPNLAISKILSRENNKVRILQEGCKGLLYMVLHARVVLDLSEKLEEEISFEQVEGDFDSFRGKWLLEQLGNRHTLLKYIVESKMHKDSFLSEAIVEEVVYEDLPSNLSAIRDYIEKGETADSLETYDTRTHSEGKMAPSVEIPKNNDSNQVSGSNRPNPLRQKRRVPGLQRDIEVLKAELKSFISQYGQEGFMPMRKQLRSHGRVDIEKAITRMGGFRKTASLMNLSLAYKNRKPKGYWDNLENLQDEISRFQRSWGMDSTYMPSRKSFERAGRYDIARALEKWGGLHEVSRLLLLKVRHPNRQPNLAKEKKMEVIVHDDKDRDDSTTYEHYISQDTQKWITELKHLDINWIE